MVFWGYRIIGIEEILHVSVIAAGRLISALSAHCC